MSSEKKQLAETITCHAWNKDKTMLAVCPGDNSIVVYKKGPGVWNKLHVLKEHDQVITGLDWAPETNRIVSCSQDRNAYVWEFQEGAWRPTLVILRLNRAATCCKWSPNEDKFAVGSAAKCVSVCYFEEDNDWWVSKHIKKHKSTVLSVDWHPSNLLLVTGSSDYTVNICSAAIRGVDKKGQTPFFSGKPAPFGNVLATFNNDSSWIHSVRFAPSGNSLAYASHDSSITFVADVTNAETAVKIKTGHLPFRSLTYLSETALVAAGYDCNPVYFEDSGNGFAEVGVVDKEEKKEEKKETGTSAAFKMFQQQASRGQKSDNDSELKTKHQNSISTVTAMDGETNAFCTTGVDGTIVVWKTEAIPSN